MFTFRDSTIDVSMLVQPSPSENKRIKLIKQCQLSHKMITQEQEPIKIHKHYHPMAYTLLLNIKTPTIQNLIPENHSASSNSVSTLLM